MNKTNIRYHDFVLMAMFAAIIIIMAFTPLGFIPLVVIKATIIHVPVIIGAIILGPKKGAVLGGLFGLTSLLVNTMTPSLTSFVFTPFYPLPGQENGSLLSLFVCFVPRILVGIIPYFVYKAVTKVSGKKTRPIALILAGLSGALTNTIFVMGLIYLLFKDSYASARGMAVDAIGGAILTVVFTNGIMEAIVASILVATVGGVLLKFRASQQ